MTVTPVGGASNLMSLRACAQCGSKDVRLEASMRGELFYFCSEKCLDEYSNAHWVKAKEEAYWKMPESNIFKRIFHVVLHPPNWKVKATIIAGIAMFIFIVGLLVYGWLFLHM